MTFNPAYFPVAGTYPRGVLFRQTLLGPKDSAAGAGEEAGLEQERHHVGLPHGLAVEALDREALRATAPDVLHERRERGPQPFLVRLAERDERAAAPLDEERRLTAEEDHLGSRDARSPCAGALGPRQSCAVRLGRVGGGEDERFCLLPLSRPELPQPLHGAGQGELRTAEAFDEVAAPADAERLERAQLRVNGAVAARDSLAADAVARDDPLALEQQLGEGAPIGLAGEEAVGRRPAALRRRDAGGALPGEAAAPVTRPGRLVSTPGAERRPRVVRHLAGPDQVPHGGECLPAV